MLQFKNSQKEHHVTLMLEVYWEKRRKGWTGKERYKSLLLQWSSRKGKGKQKGLLLKGGLGNAHRDYAAS